MKRVAVLGTFLESNRYAPVVSGNRFRCIYDDAIVEDARSESPKLLKEGQGFFTSMDQAGDWEPVGISLILGGAGGPAEAEFIEREFDRMRRQLESHGSLDGVYILNHGAMTTPLDDDPDGRLYALVRKVVGADVPIVTTVDLHANISQRMVDSASVIVSYRTDPHVDQFDRGVEAACLLREMMEGMQPIVRNIRVPIVPPNVSLLTDNGPYGDLIDYGQSQMSSEIANVSIVAGFAFGDTSSNGLHVIVSARSNVQLAESLCAEIAGKAWDLRERFLWDLTPADDAVKLALAAGQDSSIAPLLLADLGDNIGAGGPGNTLALLKALHLAKARDVLIGSFYDPAAVQQAIDSGVDTLMNVVLQGDDWDGAESELAIQDVRVIGLHPGRFLITEGPLAGMAVNAGPMCLLDTGQMRILVTSHRPLVWPDPALLIELGLQIEDIRTLVLKCRSSYRAVYGRFFKTERMIEVDTPGRTSPVLTRHHWQRTPRPAYPIDRDFEWQVPAF